MTENRSSLESLIMISDESSLSLFSLSSPPPPHPQLSPFLCIIMPLSVALRWLKVHATHAPWAWKSYAGNQAGDGQGG